MGADVIQAQYDQLEQIAARFGRQAEAAAQTTQRVQQAMRSLQSGGWEGRGAAAFFGEMDRSVLPSMQRLSGALQQSQTVTRQVSQVMRTAEEEASRPFRGQGSAPVEEGGGFWGAVGDFFTGAGAELKDMVTGLWNMITDPVGTAKGLWYGVTHPGQLWDAIKQPYVEAWESGHPWEAIGRGAVFIGSLLIGTKGLDKAMKGAKLGVGVGKAGEVASLTGKLSKAGRLSDVATIADDIGRAGKSAEIGQAAQVLARDARLAEAALQGVKSGDAALAMDAFKSAVRGLATPDAPTAIERFAKVGDSVIPNIVDRFGGPVGRAGDIPAELAGRRVTTLGRLSETSPAGEVGSRILKTPEIPAGLRTPGGPNSTWSMELNALWVREAINNGDVIKLVTDVAPSPASLRGSPRFGGVSVYTRELDALLAAGYRRVGDYLVPPR